MFFRQHEEMLNPVYIVGAARTPTARVSLPTLNLAMGTDWCRLTPSLSLFQAPRWEPSRFGKP